MTALLLGTLLAITALGFVLYPIFFPPRSGRERQSVGPLEPPRPTGEKDLAVAALREIEFDRATGKLSESDYAQLKQRYTEHALAAMRREEGSAAAAATDEIEAAVLAWRMRRPECPTHGPRPQPDALFCSDCGRWLAGACTHCGAAVEEPGARYCPECGKGLGAAA